MANANSEALIRNIIDARAKAVRAGDVDAMMADVADDVVMFDVVDPLRREGMAASRERAAEWVATYDGPISWENRDLHVAADGDVAFSHALSRVTGKLKTAAEIDMWFRTTLGFRRIAGRWVITHDHGSVPFNPESEGVARFKAIDHRKEPYMQERTIPRNGDIAVTRRDFLRAGIATAVAAGVVSPGSVFAQTGSKITPFAYRAPQSGLDDLKRRLAQTRWPERETVNDWSQGVPLAKLRALVDYWRSDYDWRRCEATLNRFAQYRTTIDGLGIHFLHVPSRHPDALPIIITHGWPGSVIEFLEIIGPLTDPTAHGGKVEDAFHFVAPSLPGFGFSDKPTARGWNADRIARAWAELMSQLGYRRYVAQGGDWGAFVTTKMAQQHAPGLAAIHLNFPQVVPNKIPAKLTTEQQRAVDALKRFETDGSGYFALQATRPQTIGYPLADSPTGQAAWIYEKFHAWTDNNGNPEDALTRDQMLDTITLYWLTDTAASSARMYSEHAGIGTQNNAGIVDLPVGCSIFPREIFPAPRDWAELVYPKLIYWNELERGGHFAAFEEPTLFSQELRAFARRIR